MYELPVPDAGAGSARDWICVTEDAGFSSVTTTCCVVSTSEVTDPVPADEAGDVSDEEPAVSAGTDTG